LKNVFSRAGKEIFFRRRFVMKKMTVMMMAAVCMAAGAANAATLGTNFMYNAWASDWQSQYDSVSIDGTFGLVAGNYVKVGFDGNPPVGDGILQKNFTRASGDTKIYKANLQWQSELFGVASGGYRTTYLDYSTNGGAYARGSEVTAVNPADIYQVQTMQTTQLVTADVTSLDVRYGTVDNGDWRTNGNLILNTSATFTQVFAMGQNFSNYWNMSANMADDYSSTSIDGSWYSWHSVGFNGYGVNFVGNPPVGDAILERQYYRLAGDTNAYEIDTGMWQQLYGVALGGSREVYIDYSLDEGATWSRVFDRTLTHSADLYNWYELNGSTITLGTSNDSLYVRFGTVDNGDWRNNGNRIGGTMVDWTVVPEPMTILMLLGGLVTMVLRRK
jgi:hypothetical protein